MKRKPGESRAGSLVRASSAKAPDGSGPQIASRLNGLTSPRRRAAKATWPTSVRAGRMNSSTLTPGMVPGGLASATRASAPEVASVSQSAWSLPMPKGGDTSLVARMRPPRNPARVVFSRRSPRMPGMWPALPTANSRSPAAVVLQMASLPKTWGGLSILASNAIRPDASMRGTEGNFAKRVATGVPGARPPVNARIRSSGTTPSARAGDALPTESHTSRARRVWVRRTASKRNARRAPP